MITLHVKPDDGDPYEVTAQARDVLTWEKTTKGNKTFLDLMSSPDMQALYKLAHIASWRQGLTTLTFQQFEASVDVMFEEDEQEPELDPTQPAPSAGPSSPSPSEPESAPPRGRRKANEQS